MVVVLLRVGPRHAKARDDASHAQAAEGTQRRTARPGVERASYDIELISVHGWHPFCCPGGSPLSTKSGTPPMWIAAAILPMANFRHRQDGGCKKFAIRPTATRGLAPGRMLSESKTV